MGEFSINLLSTMLTTKKTLVALAFAAGLHFTGKADSPVIITETPGEITIGNSLIQRRFATSNNQLKTLTITNYRTDHQATVFAPAPGSEEFIINLIPANSSSPALTALPKSAWSITASSYSTTETAPSGPPAAFIDGNTSTHWHSNYGTGSGSTTPPCHVIIDLGKPETFKSFGYLPRQNGENGIVKEYELYVSETQAGLTTATACSKGILPRNGIQRVYAGIETPQTGRYVKFVVKSAWNGQPFGSGA
ncbi:MAG: discoidin domain-containing protein, partial [Bacteroidales bacterium]|nr:discoidin domain-containing protein [Bacteroidales bacterium]